MKLDHEENRRLYFSLSRKEAAELISQLALQLAMKHNTAELILEEDTALKQKCYIFCVDNSR